MKILGFILLFAASLCHAEVAVIVHPDNQSDFGKRDIKRIFLGKLKSFSSGEQAIPLSLDEDGEVTERFNKEVMKKSSSQLNSYWSKMIFTGKGAPPKVISSNEEMVNLISKNPNLIGYVDASSAKDNTAVRVVATF